MAQKIQDLFLTFEHCIWYKIRNVIEFMYVGNTSKTHDLVVVFVQMSVVHKQYTSNTTHPLAFVVKNVNVLRC